LRSFLSQWSGRLSRADGPSCMARCSVPVLNVMYSADTLVFPAQCRSWSEAAGSRCTDYALKGATHFLLEQDALIEELADLLVRGAEEFSDHPLPLAPSREGWGEPFAGFQPIEMRRGCASLAVGKGRVSTPSSSCAPMCS
jgi:hypothetical protein